MTDRSKPDASADKAETTENRRRIGARIKTLREARGLTLQGLADRSGVAISTISKIERGLMAPTYDRFSGLARGLGVEVPDLFSKDGGAFQTGTVAVARADDCHPFETEDYTFELMFPDVHGKTMQPMCTTLRPLHQMPVKHLVSHPGEELLTVLSGRVIVMLEGRDDVILGPGDSLYFDSGRRHLYAAAGDEGARILVVCAQSRDRPDTVPGKEPA